MPNKVKPLTHILVSSDVPKEYKDLPVGSFEDMEHEEMLLQYYPEDAKHSTLPYRMYWIYAPAAHGRCQKHLGNKRLINCDADNLFILTSILKGQFKTDKAKIKSIIEKNGLIQENIIGLLHQNFSVKYKKNWSTDKAEILEKYKPILSELVSYGARIDHLDQSPELFNALVDHGLDGNALTNLLSRVEYTNHPNSFYEFEQLVNRCLPKGADINAVRGKNPDFGSFLHYYMAFELPHAVNLIRFIESKRSIKANTQFDYKRCDGFGHTPLLVALLTRNEKAAQSLVNLAEKNIKVGINTPDRDGVSPLLIAAALGMKEVVQALIAQGADVRAKDKQGRGLADYAQLNRTDTIKLLSCFMNPLRSNVKTSHFHSELYCLDGLDNTTPICLYKHGQSEVTGDAQLPHVVILSNDSPHKENQDIVLATLTENAEKGDKWSQKNVPFVRKQIDEIRHGKKFDAVVAHLQESESKGDKLAESIKSHITSLLPTPLLYREILEKSVDFCTKEMKKGTPGAQSMQVTIQTLINSTSGVDSVISQCLAGQREVRSYLQTSEAIKTMNPSKEKSLRRACALGQLRTVKELVEEGTDCNARDHLGRSSFHYTVMRAPLVKNEFIKEAEEKGEKEVSNLDQLVHDAMESHPVILDYLLQNPKLDFDARNESKNTPLDVLARDIKQTSDSISQRIATVCLDKAQQARSKVKSIVTTPVDELRNLSPS